MRWAALLLALLFIPLSMGQTDPNPRDDLTMGHPVTSVALSGQGGHMLIGMEDEGYATPLADKRQTTWSLQEVLPHAFSMKQRGDADPDACDNTLPPDDDCVTDITRVAISRDGKRAVAVGQTEADEAQIIFIELSQGEKAQRQITGRVTAIAMSDDGSQVAIGTSRTPLAPSNGQVFVYTWGSFTTPWSQDTTAPVTRLAMTPDGQRTVVAAGGDHYILQKATPHLLYKDSNMPGTAVTAVAVSATTGHVTAAGANKGDVRVYSDEASETKDPEFNMPGSQIAVTHIALSGDARRMAVAYEDGKIDVWTLRVAPILPDKRILSKDFGDTVHDLRFSRDGTYLFARVDGTMMLLTGSDPVRHVVNATMSGVTATSMDDLADRIVAVGGKTVRVFEADHTVVVDAAHPGPLIPGRTATTNVSLSNDGNRLQRGTLSANTPEGWSVTVAEPIVSMMPGAKQSKSLAIAVPAHEPPTSKSIVVSFATSRGFTNQTLEVSVPEYKAFNITRTGAPTSLPVDAGRSAVFTLRVRNDGNVAGAPPVEVRSTGDGWTAAIHGGAQSLEPGAGRDLLIALTAPDDAGQLDQGRAFVKLAGGKEIELVATVGAKFGIVMGGLEEMRVPAGSELRFNVTVKNTGNALDSYTVAWGGIPTGWTIAFGDSKTVEAKDVEPGETRAVPAVITAPLGADSQGAIGVSLTATSLADPTKQDAALVTFRAFQPGIDPGPEQNDTKKDKGSPGADTAIVALGVLGVALLARRRRE